MGPSNTMFQTFRMFHIYFFYPESSKLLNFQNYLCVTLCFNNHSLFLPTVEHSSVSVSVSSVCDTMSVNGFFFSRDFEWDCRPNILSRYSTELSWHHWEWEITYVSICQADKVNPLYLGPFWLWPGKKLLAWSGLILSKKRH